MNDQSLTGTLEFHTDAVSPKAYQITDNPNVALHIWIPKTSLQIRARATARLLPGDETLFQRLPEAAQLNYQGPTPGAPLPAEFNPQDSRFTRIFCDLIEIDALFLIQPHQRVFYTAPDWYGSWIVP